MTSQFSLKAFVKNSQAQQSSSNWIPDLTNAELLRRSNIHASRLVGDWIELE